MTIYHVEMTCCGWCELHQLLSCLPKATSPLFSEEQQMVLQTAHRRILSFVFERGLSCGQRRYALLCEPEVKALKDLCTMMEEVLLGYLQLVESTPRVVAKNEHLAEVSLALAQAEPLSAYLIRRRS